MFVSACNAPEPGPRHDWLLACDYASFVSTTDKLSHCGTRDAKGELTIRPDLLADIEAGSGVQTIHVDGDWLFALDGKTAAALTYDNGADYFQEGLARTIKGGKIGFINPSLDLVIAPTWDFAFPFENHYSVVCTGCKQESGGEHTSIVGGSWGYIDRQGKIVVELIHERDALSAYHPTDTPQDLSQSKAYND
jgi:hypothetical protein